MKNLHIFKTEYKSILAIVLIWFVFLYFKDVLNPNRSFALFTDNESFFGPLFSYIHTSLVNGNITLRIHTLLDGLPFYNSSQFSPYYPFYFTFFNLFETPYDSIINLHRITLIHVLVFFINLYFLLRVLGFNNLISILGSFLIAFSSNTYIYCKWINITSTYAWFPLFLAGFMRLLNGNEDKKAYFAAIISCVFLTLASPSQSLIHLLYCSLVLLISKFILSCKTVSFREIRIVATNLTKCAVIIFLIVSPVILPVFFSHSNMIRWIGDFPPVIGYSKIPYEAFLTDQLNYDDLFSIILPINDNAVGSIYIGPVVLTLVFVPLFFSKKNWILTALYFLFFYSFLSSFGSNFGLAKLNYNIPLLNMIREPTRFLFIFHLVTGIIVVYSIKTLKDKLVIPEEKRVWIYLVISFTLMLLIIAFKVKSEMLNTINYLISIGIIFVLALFSFLLLFVKHKVFRNSFFYFIYISTAAILILNVKWATPEIASSDYLRNKMIPLEAVIKKVSNYDSKNNNDKVIFGGSINKQLAGMLSVYYNLKSLSIYVNPLPFNQFSECYHHGPTNNNWPYFHGIKYLICENCSIDETIGFYLYDSFLNYKIYKANNYLPYYVFKNQIDGTSDFFNEVIGLSSSLDLNKKLIFLENKFISNFNSSTEIDSSSQIYHSINSPNYLLFKSHSEKESILFVNEFFSDDWHAKINGTKTDIVRINSNKIGIIVPPGSNIIEFNYFPIIFYYSLPLSLIGIFLFFYFLFIKPK